MRKLIIILVVILSGCSKEKIDINESKLNGTWMVISFEDHIDNTIEHKNEENSWGLDITIKFNDSKQPRTVSGTNLTNSFSGQYNYVSENQFQMLEFEITEINHPEWGEKFLQAISDENNQFTVNQDQLRIYYEDKMKSVLLERQWKVTKKCTNTNKKK